MDNPKKESVFKKKWILFLLFINIKATASSKIIITSIPKCGTHLLRKCIELMIRAEFKHTIYDHLVITDRDIKFKKYIIGHALPTIENIEKLKKAGFKVIFIYRDPRDQSVSMINMVKVETNWFPKLRALSFDNALSRWFAHTSELYWGENHWLNPELKNFKGIDDLYYRYLKWSDLDSDFVYVTTYEKLAGPESGGNLELQLQELLNIARHIGVKLSKRRAKRIARKIYGPKKPGRKQISSWRRYFKKHHKQEFKEIAGDLLIELGYETDFNW